MNPDDPFEKRLRRQPLRSVPPEWRGQILAAAAQATRPVTRPANQTPWWRELFWPCPQAWAALGAVWLVIVGINLSLREPASPTWARQEKPTNEMRELLRQQERLFAELIGPLPQPADRPRTVPPQSRWQRREEFLNA